jgi:hypothetical protein
VREIKGERERERDMDKEREIGTRRETVIWRERERRGKGEI